MSIFLWMLGCAPSVGAAPSEFAMAMCERAMACGWVTDTEECEADNAEIYADWVNEEECPDGIDADAWATCMDGLAAVDCDDNVRGWGAAAQLCDAQEVCIRE